MNNNSIVNLEVGAVVASKSHPFYQVNQDILISGEPTNLSPLMVVVEMKNETATLLDENTGENITSKGKGRCRCIWYSLKDNTFSDAWFPFDSLKLIDVEMDKLILDNIEKEYTDPVEFLTDLNKKLKNKRVLFKTTDLETKKIKETASHQADGSIKQKLSSLLSFVCPPLEIIQVKIVENKSNSARFDSRNGTKKQFTSTVQIKCRFYLGSSNKWSEHLLPIESVILLEEINEGLISTLNEIIESNKYIRFEPANVLGELKQTGEAETIMRPTHISYLNGRYSLKGEDIIHNQKISLNIENDILTKIKELDVKDVFSEESFPKFKFIRGERSPSWEQVFIEFQEFIDGQSLVGDYIHISYQNKQDKIINRTLKDYFVVPGVNEKAKHYLHGFCCCKQEERSFRYDRIQSIKVFKAV